MIVGQVSSRPSTPRTCHRSRSVSGRRFEVCQRIHCLGNTLHLARRRVLVRLGSGFRVEVRVSVGVRDTSTVLTVGT